VLSLGTSVRLLACRIMCSFYFGKFYMKVEDSNVTVA
jgi:hypothetical protein